MKEKVGKFPAGTILANGNSMSKDLSLTQIDVYACRDNGYTWEFVSKVASGGAAVPDNGVPAIWEPFLLTYKGQIVRQYIHYSTLIINMDTGHTQSTTLTNVIQSTVKNLSTPPPPISSSGAAP